MRLAGVQPGQKFTYDGATYAHDLAGRSGGGKVAVVNIDTGECSMLHGLTEVDVVVESEVVVDEDFSVTDRQEPVMVTSIGSFGPEEVMNMENIPFEKSPANPNSLILDDTIEGVTEITDEEVRKDFFNRRYSQAMDLNPKEEKEE